MKAELDGFAGCGDFEKGFVRTACRTCGDELRVPFACKGRGFCPSCMGRRMAEGAALLVDHVLPAVGVRQWVLSFEGRMAVRLGYDRALLARVAGAFARALLHDMRWEVKERHGLASVQPLHAGVFTAVQRFRSDLGLYVHLHCLVTDGAFEEAGADVRFLPARAPTPGRMTAVLAQVHKAVVAVAEDDDLDIDPALAACVQLALAGPHTAAPQEAAARPSLTVSAFGMHLHAATTVDGRDRKQLERLCRYLLRPPFAHDAVKALPDGRVRVLFKAPWRSGVAHADMAADKFLARLCALVPPPGFHMLRYYGVFASHHHLRARIVPAAAAPPELQLVPAAAAPPELQLALDLTAAANDTRSPTDASPRPRRLGWAKLLARVFAVDVTVCRKCGGRMRVLEVVSDPDDIARVLHGARAPPPRPRPDPPGQVLLFAG
ncbi:MAG: transposase [Nannocystis sp.]|nr:transposase [Nannocystis sp.]